ncbi:MAG: 30S ribosomal protein S9 [Candidatus Aenigmatarchaeota archaeon]
MVEKKVDKNIVFTIGKRRKAIARARFKPGKGIIKLNSKPIDKITNELVKLKIQEPLLVLGDEWKGYDVKINATGGGVLGQADAARQALARGFVEIFGDTAKEKFMSYDRNLLVYDPRRTEPHKPSRSSQGPRRHKQRSKR